MKPMTAYKFFGNRSACARALGIHPSSTFTWDELGEVPEGRQYQIELATGGKLKASVPALRCAEYRRPRSPLMTGARKAA